MLVVYVIGSIVVCILVHALSWVTSLLTTAIACGLTNDVSREINISLERWVDGGTIIQYRNRTPWTLVQYNTILYLPAIRPTVEYRKVSPTPQGHIFG